MSITLVGRFGIPGWRLSQVFVKQLTPPERKTLVDKNLKNSDQKYVEPQIYLQLCRREIWIFLSGPQSLFTSEAIIPQSRRWKYPTSYRPLRKGAPFTPFITIGSGPTPFVSRNLFRNLLQGRLLRFASKAPTYEGILGPTPRSLPPSLPLAPASLPKKPLAMIPGIIIGHQPQTSCTIFLGGKSFKFTTHL